MLFMNLRCMYNFLIFIYIYINMYIHFFSKYTCHFHDFVAGALSTNTYIYIDKHSPSVHRLEGPTSQPASTISEGKWLSLSNISPCWCLFLPLGTPVKIRNEGVRMGEVSKFQGSTMCFVFFFGGGQIRWMVQITD